MDVGSFLRKLFGFVKRRRRSPQTAQVLLQEIDLAKGYHPQLDQKIQHVHTRLDQVLSKGNAEAQARSLGADLALALQGSLLARYAPHAVSDAFCMTRLDHHARVYGDFPVGVATDDVLDSLRPIIEHAQL